MTEHDHHHPLRPLLGNWLWERGRIGLRWLRCADGALGFDEGRKAQFADEVPIRVSLTADAASPEAAAWPAVPPPITRTMAGGTPVAPPNNIPGPFPGAVR